MDNQGVAHLYKKVVSPSLTVTAGNTWQRQPHCRHVNEYQKHDRASINVRNKASSPVRSIVSSPGCLETVSQATNADQDNAQDQPDRYEVYNFLPTVRFKTLSLPAMPLSRRYTPSPTGTSRSVPLTSSRYLMASQKLWTSEKVLASSQRERISEEEKKKQHCRKLKRTSEILKHRIDKQYYMAGAGIPIRNKYDVDSGELLKLRLLANRRQLAEYNSVKDNDINPRESPSGQMSTPIPGSDGKHGSTFLSSTTELEVQVVRDGKWAEGVSETSSVDEFDSVSVRGTKNPELGRGVWNNNDINAPEAKSDELQNNQESLNDEGSQKERDPDKDSQSDKQPQGDTQEITNKSSERKKKSLPTRVTKKGRIRFKDEERVKRENGTNNDEKKNKEGKENKDEKSDDGSGGERRNKYLDEWLGLKPKEPEDERYIPGKRPPNRIFLSSNPVKAKGRKHKKSAVFLTEITEVNLEHGEVLQPESFGIITHQQKGAFGVMFDEIDKDKNGSVTLEEMKKRMMPSLTRDDIKHFLRVFDLNKDKTVDKREFTAICALNDKLAGTRTESEDASLALDLENLSQNIVIFKEMFKTIDEDDDNRLDAIELLVMVSAAMETEIGADLNLARQVLEGARDEFGFIDFIGFISYLPFFATLIKAVMEHPLTIPEIEQARERVKQKDLTFKAKTQLKEPKSWEVY